MQILIQPDGAMRYLYDETLDLQELGQLHIERGSYVEPNTAGQWTANLSPVNGPLLGPFPNRSAALSAEHDWLNKHWLISGP